MGPAQAIRTCVIKSFQTSGRASRSEFWGFAPLGVALPIAVGCLAPQRVTSLGTFLVKLAMVVLAAVPLTPVASRRFHDTGAHHDEFWRGIGPSLGVVVFGFCLIFGLFAVFTIWGAVLGIVITIASALMFLGCLFVAPGTFGATPGQLIVPSQPNSNRYGPNPSEASN